MNTEGYDKTDGRHPEDGVDIGADQREKIGEIGGLSSPGGAEGVDQAESGADDPAVGVVEVLMEAEEPEERGRGAPKKPARARKDALRAYAAELGAEPGELLIETVMGGLKDWLAQGNDLHDWLDRRAAVLAANTGLKPGEAFKQLSKMLGDLMPYTHQKLPQAIEIEGGEIVFGVVIDGQLQPAQGGIGNGLDLRPAHLRHPPQIVSNNDKSETKSDAESRTDEEESQS